MGPHFAGIFDPRAWGPHSDAITLEVMRVVLATGLFAIGVELPKSYMAKHAKSLLAMILPTMAIGWVIVAGMTKVSTIFIVANTLTIFSLRNYERSFSAAQLLVMLSCVCLSDSNRPHHLRCYRWQVQLLFAIVSILT